MSTLCQLHVYTLDILFMKSVDKVCIINAMHTLCTLSQSMITLVYILCAYLLNPNFNIQCAQSVHYSESSTNIDSPSAGGGRRARSLPTC